MVHGVGDTRPPLSVAVAHRAHLPNGADDIVDAAQPDVIFHLASPVDLRHGADVHQQLQPGIVDATIAIARAAVRQQARLVLVSSCAVYEGSEAPFAECGPLVPRSPYGQLKRAAEAAANEVENLSMCTVRPFRTYGPGCETGLIADVCRAIATDSPIQLTDGRQVREWNHVSAIATGIIAAGAHPAGVGQVLNLGGGDRLGVAAIAHRIVELANADVALLQVGAAPRRPCETDRFWGDHRRTEHLWGPLPHPALDAALRDTLQWHLRQLEQGA